ANHRRLPAASEPARNRCQARSRARTSSVHKRALAGATLAQAILLKDVEGLGEAGAVVDVSAGYLRNYLGPRRLAQVATPASAAAAKRRLEQAERAAHQQEERAHETASLLTKTVLTIPHLAGDGGR